MMKDALSTMDRSPDLAKPIWVAAVGLVNESGRVLMQQRPLDREHGGLWEFPGGKLEPDEAPIAAAVRELVEELGVTVEPPAMRAVTFACGLAENRSPPRPLTILLFTCSRWQGDPEPHAATQLAWIAPEDLSGLRMPPLDYPLAAALVKMLSADAH